MLRVSRRRPRPAPGVRLGAGCGRPAPARPPAVRGIAYSPDGKDLVAGGAKDQPGGPAAWDGDTLKRLWQRPGPAGFTSVSFAPGGKEVAVACGTTFAADRSATGPNSARSGPHPAGRSGRWPTFRAPTSSPPAATARSGCGTEDREGGEGAEGWAPGGGHVAGGLAGREVARLHRAGHNPRVGRGRRHGAERSDPRAGSVLRDRRSSAGPVLIADNSGGQAVRELPSGKVILRFRQCRRIRAVGVFRSRGTGSVHRLRPSRGRGRRPRVPPADERGTSDD